MNPDPAPAPLEPVARPQVFSWVRLKALVLTGVSSVHTRRAYKHALDAFHSWYTAADRGPFGKSMLEAYRAELEQQGLASSSINVQLAALRKLATEAAEHGLLAPEIAAGIEKVRGARQSGIRAGNWLTRHQAEQLLRSPDVSTLKGLRDQALLALLIGCGLRRAELAALTIEEIQQRDGRWVVVDLVGKGRRVRSVPMPGWAKAAVDRWTHRAGITAGRILRPVNKGGQLTGESMTAQAIFEIVDQYARALGLDFAPHDLRRTFAKLAHRGQAPVDQIQLSLGHASLKTTERYLGIEQDLVDAPCDRLGIKLGN